MRRPLEQVEQGEYKEGNNDPECQVPTEVQNNVPSYQSD